ncbi:thiamine diphosphokinase [Falsirhodobacter halotolerans]|uniref:thiamine diphosphokinase n=1 Tax=Falsirhodobacter halotolerans TaxID=1146892 RepID=UPI001FD4134B|nr:thiamine diphosphokinase [Falsirhodobacter halotolerans]MCJ8139924.1 thiamine diphosphokinase [Falsirhodobacter halotolerans]
MTGAIVQSSLAITLIGGGPVALRDLRACVARSDRVVAADGGAQAALRAGVMPDAVVGDLDSLGPAARARLAGRLHPVAEQDSTDLDKALRAIDAPLILGLGFLGGRVDHTFAALRSLAEDRRALLLIGRRDVALHLSRPIALELAVGDRVSLCPMGPVRGRAMGLRWPINDLDFQPMGPIGTSNAALDRRVTLDFDGPGMILIVPRRRLGALIRAVSNWAR